MLKYNEIMNYCSNYIIKNGNVIEKNTGNIIKDEDIILKVKTSVLVFKEAKESYQTAMQQFGKTSLSQEDYLKKSIERFGLNNEVNNYGSNKLVNAILNSNGHYEENISGKDLANSKFSMIVPPKQEYGLALLKLKFREKGLDIEDLRISQDLTELQHNGSSKVIIDFKIKRYEKQVNNSKSSMFQHPRANELNELEKQKQIAKQNNDEVTYNHAQANIERIIQQNRLEVSPTQWDSMNIDEQIAFVKTKIIESKVLRDQDEFNYWNSNLRSLEFKKNENGNIHEYHNPVYNTPKANEISITPEETIHSETIQEEKTYKQYYDEMIKAIKIYNPNQNYSEEEKKKIIGEIFYNEGYMVDRLSNENDIKDIMSLSINDLSNNDLENRLSNIIITDIQDKYNDLYQKREKSKEEVKESIVQEKSTPDLDLSGFINQLKNELNKISNSYRMMLSDGYIDDVELATLIVMINKVIDNSYSLKSMATTQNEKRTIAIIIDTLEEEKKKMTKIQNGIEEIGRSM